MVAKAYDESRFKSIRGRLFGILRNRIFDRITQTFPNKGTAFDLACGTGLMSVWLINRGYSIVSGDLSKGMLQEARTKLKGSKNLQGLLQLDATRLPFRPKSFEIITSFRFLNLMPPDIRINIHKEASRIGKDVYMISYALNSSYQRIRGRIKALLGLSIKEGADVYPASFEEIRNELAEARIDVIKMCPVFRLLTSEVVILGRIRD